ncbi:MAG: hypothetical protein ACTHK0_04300 [Ginsengibacter sp.]
MVEVYFPKCEWFEFNTNKKYQGERKYAIHMSLDKVPMFLKFHRYSF